MRSVFAILSIFNDASISEDTSHEHIFVSDHTVVIVVLEVYHGSENV